MYFSDVSAQERLSCYAYNSSVKTSLASSLVVPFFMVLIRKDLSIYKYTIKELPTVSPHDLKWSNKWWNKEVYSKTAHRSHFPTPLHPSTPRSLGGHLAFASQGIANAPNSGAAAPRRFIFLLKKSTGAYFSWQMPHPRNCQVVKYPMQELTILELEIFIPNTPDPTKRRNSSAASNILLMAGSFETSSDSMPSSPDWVISITHSIIITVIRLRTLQAAWREWSAFLRCNTCADAQKETWRTGLTLCDSNVYAEGRVHWMEYFAGIA